jgi:signal transduction histidine kinase
MDTIGSIFTIAITVALIFAIVALIRTNIQRARLLEDLSTAHRHLRLAAGREADLATMRERNRLAREMHDSLGHALVSIAIKLEAVRLLYPVDSERATRELDDTTALVRSTMTELRHSLAGLRPAVLEEQPLQRALAELTRDMGQRTGITAEHCIDAQTAELDRGMQEAFYRVSQEALTNVAKHAAAQHVALSLAVRDGAAMLEVSDDGVGLGGAPRPGSGGLGVLGMRERIEALGGTLTIGPRSDRGTVLRARIPMRE